MVIGVFSVASAGWCGTTISDNFNDGNDAAPPIAWQRYDPIGVALTAQGIPTTNAQWNFPGGNTYQIVADPSPDPLNLGQARAGSIAPSNFTNFYAAVDVVDWDHSSRQIFGILARVSNVGPGTTDGYMFTWDSGDPNSTTAGDMDIVRIAAEQPADLDNQTFFGNDSIHLITGHSYRFIFMGVSNVLRGQVYDLTNTVIPLVDYAVTDPQYDPNGADYVSGPVGLIVANNDSASGYSGGAGATFDNFVASDEHLLSASWTLLSIIKPSPVTVDVMWPWGGTYTLYGSPTLQPPNWGSALTPTGTNGAENVYSVSPAAGNQFFQLVP